MDLFQNFFSLRLFIVEMTNIINWLFAVKLHTTGSIYVILDMFVPPKCVVSQSKRIYISISSLKRKCSNT